MSDEELRASDLAAAQRVADDLDAPGRLPAAVDIRQLVSAVRQPHRADYPHVEMVTKQQCRDGIAEATAKLAALGVTPEELDEREPECHHEREPYEKLCKWRYLLNGTLP